MKRLKKVFAVLLTLTMVLGMSATVFATDVTDVDEQESSNTEETTTTPAVGTAVDTGTITVRGIEYEEGVTVTAYQIIEALYENPGDYFSGYNVLYDTTPAIEISDDATITISEAQLTQLVDYINLTKLGGIEMNLSETGVATANDLPVGSYLVVISGAETKVYSPVVASIYYSTNEGGTENVLEEADFNITTQPAWVKVSDTPEVEKWIIEEDGETKGNSINIGDEIEYQVKISPVPYYGGSYPKLQVVDTLDTGLSLVNRDNIVVYVNNSSILTDEDDGSTGAVVDYQLLEKGSDYTVEISGDGKEITVDFVVDGGYKLNDYVGKTVIIQYSAEVTKDADLNQDANENDVVLTYSRDSKTEGNDGNDDDKVYSYTFDIDGNTTGTKKVLTKTGEDNDMTADADGDEGLVGAEFTLYTDKDCKKVYKNEVFDGTVTSIAGGQLPIKGLEEGTYYLKETKAPEGYSLNTNVFKIEIKADYEEDGQIKDWTITIDGKATSTFNVAHGEIVVEKDEDGNEIPNVNETQIPNTKLTSLPSTGGIGTTIFTIGGCAIIIIAAGLFFASRRKSAK